MQIEIMAASELPWTEQTVVFEAQKYNSVIEWKQCSPESLEFALKERDLFLKCIRHIPNAPNASGKKWPNEAILADSKQYICKTDWFKASPSAYMIASRNKILFEKCTAHMISGYQKLRLQEKFKDTELTDEKVLAIAQSINSIKRWRHSFPNSYLEAKSNPQLFEHCIAHMNDKDTDGWVPYRVLKVAETYATEKEWEASHPYSYRAAKKDKALFKRCISHMVEVKSKPVSPKAKPPSDKEILDEAQKHSSISQWLSASKRTCDFAKENKKLYAKCVAHMKSPGDHWTNREILKEAQKYSTETQWKQNSSASYRQAKKDPKLFKKCTEHMGYFAMQKRLPF